MAKACGSVKAVNVVMIGVMARRTGIDREIWLNAIKKIIKPQFVDMNIKAFNMGYEFEEVK